MLKLVISSNRKWSVCIGRKQQWSRFSRFPVLSALWCVTFRLLLMTFNVGAQAHLHMDRHRVPKSNLVSLMLFCSLMNKRKYRMIGQQKPWPPLKSRVSKLVLQTKILAFSWGNRVICNSLTSIDLRPHKNIPFEAPSRKLFSTLKTLLCSFSK